LLITEVALDILPVVLPEPQNIDHPFDENEVPLKEGRAVQVGRIAGVVRPKTAALEFLTATARAELVATNFHLSFILMNLLSLRDEAN